MSFLWYVFRVNKHSYQLNLIMSLLILVGLASESCVLSLAWRVGTFKHKALNVTVNVTKLRYVNSTYFFVQNDNASIMTCLIYRRFKIFFEDIFTNMHRLKFHTCCSTVSDLCPSLGFPVGKVGYIFKRYIVNLQ